ncbi:MAG: YihY family inner membrane protein [Lautropia sp.]
MPRMHDWLEPRIAKTWLLLQAMGRQAARLQLAATASSLAFLTLLAIVPVMTVVLLVLASVPAFADAREQLQAFLAANLLLPQVADAVMSHVNQFAAAAGRLSLLGTMVFVLTAFSTMLTIDHTLNGIWRSARPRPLITRLGLYWITLTLGPLLLAALIAINVRIDSAIGDGWQLDLGAPTWLPWVFTTLLLALVYRVVPNRPVRLSHALVGAGSAAALLELLKSGLELYVTSFPTYEVVYGAFSVLPVFLLWLFALWLVVLLGALIAANLGFADTDAQIVRGPRDEFERACRVIAAVASEASRGEGVAVRDLGPLFGNSARTADRIGHALARLGYLVRVWPVRAADASSGASIGQVWAERWLAPAGLGQATLRALYDEIWQRGRLTVDAPPGRIRRAAGRTGQRFAPGALRPASAKAGGAPGAPGRADGAAPRERPALDEPIANWLRDCADGA